ncbi:MAG: GGDEF domain-containing protein [Chitinivibrionales bacterium]
MCRGQYPNINEISNIKRISYENVIEIASGDLETHIKECENNPDILGEGKGFLYNEVIFALVQIKLPEEEAREDWKTILRHKFTVSERLGRNIGIHVAALDYYMNIKKRLLNPTVVNADAYAETASSAIIDELTKSYNRGFLDQELGILFKKARKTGKELSLILLDIDHFKHYNDINGHIKGDIALIQLVSILHGVCRTDTRVARYGGEEFCVILPDVGMKEALKTAENIRLAVNDYKFDREELLPSGKLTVSMGIAKLMDYMEEKIEFLRGADIALYRAKSKGRDRIEIFYREIENGKD